MNATEAEWQAYSYVTRSKYRTAAITHLGVGDATPTQLANASDLPVTHVSRALRRLSDRGFVALQVPESTKRGRYYGLTKRGEEMAAMIAERGHHA